MKRKMKSVLERVKEESRKAALKLNIRGGAKMAEE